MGKQELKSPTKSYVVTADDYDDVLSMINCSNWEYKELISNSNYTSKLFQDLRRYFLVLGIFSDERMSQDLPHFHPILRLLLHYPQDEILSLGTHINVLWELNIVRYDSVEIKLWVYSERNLAKETLIGHHADGPNVNLLVIWCFLHYFRRIVERWSWNGFSHAISRVHSPSEITDLDSPKIKQNVLWLDISMNNFLLVDVVQPFTYFSDNWTHVLLFHPSVFSELL